MSTDDFDDGGEDEENEEQESSRRPTVRPVSRITSSPAAKLRNAKCFTEVDRRIRLGWSSVDIADMIQEEYQEFLDTSKKYLRKIIEDYRKTIPPAELSMASPGSAVANKATKALSDGIDGIKELEKLYRIQEKRIGIDFENEQKINKLLGGTGREVFVACKIIRQIEDLKMDLGLTKRHIGSMEVTGQLAAEISGRYENDSIGKVISDPDSRRKVLGIAERLLQLGAKASIDALENMQIKQEKGVIDIVPVPDSEEEPE